MIKKAQIAAFPKVMDDELSRYVSTLHEKEHTLKELQNDLGRLMRECHITEVIRENKENRRRVNEALQLTTGECSILREMMAAPTGTFVFKALETLSPYKSVLSKCSRGL